MAANSTTYDIVADLLSTNNSLNVATLVGALVFGVIAVYGCVSTWYHQRWERQLERGGVVDAGRGDLEAGTQAEAYAMRDSITQWETETAVEEHTDGVYGGSLSSSQSAPSTLAARENIHEPMKIVDPASRDVDDIRGHIATSDNGLQHGEDALSNAPERGEGSDATTHADPVIGPILPSSNTGSGALLNEDNDLKIAAEGS